MLHLVPAGLTPMAGGGWLASAELMEVSGSSVTHIPAGSAGLLPVVAGFHQQQAGASSNA